MEKINFEQFKSNVVDSFEDIYKQEDSNGIRNAKSFNELAEVLVELEYWSVSDAIDYSQYIN